MNKELYKAMAVLLCLMAMLSGCARWRETGGSPLQGVRPQLGVRVRVSQTTDLGARIKGAKSESLLVVGVKPDSAAARAGIVAGDVLLAVDGKPISNAHDTLPLMRRYHSGDRVKVTAWRAGTAREVTMQLH